MIVCNSSRSATSLARIEAGFMDIPRAQAEHAIAGLEHAADFERDLFAIRLEERVFVPFLLHLVHDRLPAHPGNRRFARGIHVRDDTPRPRN